MLYAYYLSKTICELLLIVLVINLFMSEKHNTGFSPRSSNLSRNEEINNNISFIPRYSKTHSIPVQQLDRNPHHNGAYRSQKFPDQLNFDDLVNSKEVLHQLMRQFGDQNGKVVFEPYKKEQYSKRLMLLQQEIEGLMRQSYLYAAKNPGQRTLDYSSLITEKQNQVNQLERKISYLQSQLRMKDKREQELEYQLEKRFESIRNKNNEIERLKGAEKSYSQKNAFPNEVVNSMARKLMSSLDNLLKKGNLIPSQLENQVQSWIMGLPVESVLKQKIRSADENWLEDKYKRYVSYLTTEAASVVNNIQKLYTSQIVNLKSKGAPVDYDPKIMNLFGQDGVNQQFFPPDETIFKTQVSTTLGSQPLMSGLIGSRNYNNMNKVTVQVPVQDTRTKALITILARQMKRLCTKYPKLASEISPELSEYMSQQIIDVIDVDQLDRLVQIVKYKPDVVKVENVYTFNKQKNRRAQFHLKVLIKALLQQMERIRLKTGVQPEIDEGVIGMIKQEIVDVVNVEDILRVYRVVPKIVEVEKVVEQVVEKIVPVPHYVTVQLNNTEVIPVNTVKVVNNTVNVPLQVNRPQPLIQQKLVLGDQYHEKILLRPVLQQNAYEVVKEVPSLRTVDKIVPLEQEVVRTVQVPGPEKIVPIQTSVVQKIIEEKIVPVQKIVERIVEVEKIVQKIIEVVKQVPKIVVVQKIIEKLVPQIQYVESKRLQNHVVEKPLQVICKVQKIVPIQRIVEKIVIQTEIVQKIVPVKEVYQVIKEIEIIKQVPIYMTKLQVQDRIIEKPTPHLIQQVIKPVDQFIEIPLIQQKKQKVIEYRKQPVIEREEKLIRQPVNIQVPVYLTEQKLLQVDKHVVQFVKHEVPKQIIKQRIVPIETVRDQLIPTPFIVQKVIQKMVEVPRIVEIEKIVEKIVPVPRIVEKIVEVEKIIEKIVERNIYHTNIQQIQRLTQVPFEVETVITRNYPEYVEVRKQIPVQVKVQVPVVSQVNTEKVKIVQIQQPPRVEIMRQEVPVDIIRQKLTTAVIQDHVYVELKEQIVVPIQLPVPKTLIQQKLVPVQCAIPVIQYVDKVREKIVEVEKQMPGQLIVRDQIVEKLVVQREIEKVRDQIPYYNETIKQVEVIVEKPIPIELIVQQIRQVPHIIQKIVSQVTQIPKIYEVPKIVQVPIVEQQLITVDRIVPKIVTLNKAFAQIVDKLHHIPRLVQEVKQVQRKIESIEIEKHQNSDVISTEVMIEKAVIQEKLKQVDKYINVINESLNVVERIVEKPSEPIIIYEQKILQVPVIVEKLAERIVVMPQIVEVLKYVYDITENDNLGMAVGADIGADEAEYQRLGKNVNKELSNLRNMMMNLKGVPQYQNSITIVDKFLAEFNKFLAVPRLRQVMTEKIVNNTIEKEKVVRVPTRSSEDEKRSLASAVLIDKLLTQLKRIKIANPKMQMNLDPEIVEIFGTQLEPISSKYGNNYNQLLQEYNRAIFNKFNSYGTFTPGHQSMLKQFIEERFDLASKMKKLSKDAAKYKELNNGLVQKYNREQQYNEMIRRRWGEIQGSLREIIMGILDLGMKSSVQTRVEELSEVIFGYASGADTPVYRLGQLDDERSNRYLRQKDSQILQYRRVIDNLKKQLEQQRVEQKSRLVYTDCPVHTRTIRELQEIILQLKRQISQHSCPAISKPEDHTKCNLQIKRLNQQLNRIRIELNKAREQIRILNIEIVRLRVFEKEHKECAAIIQMWKKKYNESKNGKTQNTEEEIYGRNFDKEYVYQGNFDNSRQSSNSMRSDNIRGVYRSAGGYTGGLNESQKAISLQQLPQGYSLTGSGKTGGVETDLLSAQGKSPNLNIKSIEGKELAFSKKYSSKSGSSEGGSSGLYGGSSRDREVRRGSEQ